MTTSQETIRPRWRSRQRMATTFFVLLAAVAVLSPLLYQRFRIPSRSMLPTLLVGDQFFVNKYAYGYSRFSFPFWQPAFSGRIFGSTPERGDVIVFRSPSDTKVDWIKRVVGLPGDRIQMKQGKLFINGLGVPRERLGDSDFPEACNLDPGAKAERWRETLPNGASYDILDCFDNGSLDNTSVYTVPPDHLFVLGDNRDNSVDSRLPSVGYVPLDNVVGRAAMIIFSSRFGRIGKNVR